MVWSLAFITLGIVLLELGGAILLRGAVEVARIFGLSERVVGLTIVADGTGLPQVVTSLVSSYRGRDDVAIGNVIGSNLFNILGVLGISAFAGRSRYHRQRQLVDARSHLATFPDDAHGSAHQPLGRRGTAGDLCPVSEFAPVEMVS